jgi:hypothetical protein
VARSTPLRPLPSLAYVQQRLSYDQKTGKFTWLPRPLEQFADEAKGRSWNTRYAGKTAGFNHAKGYRQIAIDDMKFMEHRVAWLMVFGSLPPADIDHIDGNRSNNRIANLRAATRAENLWNAQMSRSNTSGAKGVGWDTSRGKFEAHITYRYKKHHLGRFDTFDEALEARREAAKRFYGVFARDG